MRIHQGNDFSPRSGRCRSTAHARARAGLTFGPPLAAYYRVPLLVCIGAVSPRPVAVAGQVVVRPMLTLTATFDPRYVDGYHAAQFAQALQRHCAHPEAC